MKEILDRHTMRLSPEERQSIRERVSRARGSESRARSGWLIPAAAAAVALAVMAVVVVVRREPVALRHAAPPHVESTARVEGPAPSAERATPGAAILGAQAGAHEAPKVLASGSASAPAHRGARRPAAETTARPEVAPSPAAATTGTVAGRITSATSEPVPYANVVIVGTRQGTMTDEQGNFVIPRVTAGEVELRAMAIGYDPQSRKVDVSAGGTAEADFRLGGQKVVQETETIEITANRPIDTKSSTTKQTITPGKLREIPVDNLRSAVGTVRGGELRVRGGRSGEVIYQVEGATAGAPTTPPVVPTTGGSRLPNDQPYDSMFFRNYGVNPFVAADEDALSTFAVDVDAASYTVMRRYIGLGHLPPADAVRVEEFVNFFRQGYPRFENEDFRILIDGAPSPFRPGYALLRIGIKGREVAERDRKPAQLTFVIDCSGSMERENRLELVKRALRLLVGELRGDDQVGIVVFGTNGRVLLQPAALGGRATVEAGERRHADELEADAQKVTGGGRQRVLQAIEQLRPEGSTNAEEGLRLGYDMARRAYREGAINRIVLCSDGVANEGLTGPESILARVRREADRGIHLTTIGFGMGNYNDVLLEQLADQGDGNHYYVDDLDEARRVLVENATGTLQTIAKDAKVQVEFDSTRVLRYRLLGFENRDIADRDFRNDKVDAGEIGAGHEVTALYEVKLAPGVATGTLATVRFRYALPENQGAGAPRVREIAQRFDVSALERRFEDAAPRFRLDAAVAQYAEILRGSYWAKESRLSDVLPVARSAAHAVHDDASAEFVTLLEKAAEIAKREKPGQSGVER